MRLKLELFLEICPSHAFYKVFYDKYAVSRYDMLIKLHV